MELRHLRYLVAIADAGAFVRAAEALRVAQPALTRQIHDLERELDTELFDSRARRATLTPAGEAAVAVAREALEAADRAVARARLSNSGVLGRCTIGSGPVPLLTGIVPRFVARMRARYPGIELTLSERGGRVLWDAVARGDDDIGVGIGPTEDYPTLLAETQYVHVAGHVLLAPTHPLAGRETLSLADLREAPFISIEPLNADIRRMRAAILRELERLDFPEASLRPREFPSFESLVAHVRAGQGWCLTPSPLAGRVPGLATVPLTDFACPFITARFWRDGERRKVVLTVLRELRRFAEEETTARATAGRDADAEHPPADEFVPARLELRHLRTCVAVAASGSLGRAAEALSLTQPALSRQVRELEYDVGVALFERESRGVRPTVAGEHFVEDCRELLAIVDRIPREVERAERAVAQRCLCGVVPNAVVDRLAASVTDEMERRTPRVRIGLRPIATPFQPDALREGEIDIAIGHAYPVPARERPGITVHRIGDDRLGVALLAVGHPLARSASLGLGDLADIPFLWVSRAFQPPFYDAVFERFRVAGVRPRVDATYDGLLTLWTLAAQGLGWTLGWRTQCDEPPPGLRAVPLHDFDLPWGLEVSHREDESRTPVLATIEALLAHARALRAPAPDPGAVLQAFDTSRAAMS